MDEKQERFMTRLEQFIAEVSSMPRFKGQARVISSLTRITKLAVFK